MKRWCACVLVALSAAAAAAGSSDTDGPLVTTRQGVLRGRVLRSRLGRDIYSFRGVRFAQPPLGALRFQPPVAPQSWDGVRNATEDGLACPQPGVYPTVPASEDCLFLNVYSTKLPDGGDNPKRPVLVFFHAGGWYSNTGRSTVYGPQYLADQDIVLVTTNYRLGSLGFLSTGDGVMKGNNGMKDQVMTLRWVQQNIAAFGGDPGSVTIGGYSVGGASVWMHMFSPMTTGLFHRGISMSGSINTFWNVDGDPMRLARRQSALLGCPSNSSTGIRDCLLQKGAQEIASTFSGMQEWGYDPVLVWTPVIEPDLGDGEERYLVDHPRDLLLSGNFTQVPWLTGITTDEFAPDAFDVLWNSTLTEDMDRNFDRVAPISYMYERGTENSRRISQGLRQFYLGDQPLSNASDTGLGHLYADALIGFGEDRNAKLVSRMSTEPVYFYKFSYQGRYSHRYYPGTTKPYGVVHHDDLIYLFYISVLFPYFTSTDPETLTVERLTTLWGNFVRTGNPTPGASSLLGNVTWPTFNERSLNYLDIGSQLVVKQGLYQDRFNTWDRLFPLPSSH
ncbi:esterase E4-like [Bacillus rossius redtenbacheri]|uniref:esterase E4-like n=1 Tax=Bacillus rossius redtenbacheri TaxID=93214 RepID=UPI002FDDEFCC